MEEILKAILLAVIQGITEWFPISSSGHLVLFEKILGYSGGLLFDVSLHFGTLMAIFVYFGKDITDIIRDFLLGKWKSDNGRMAWFLLIATIPAGIAGFLLKDFFDTVLTNLWIVAFGFGVTGLFLFITSLDYSKNGGGLSYGKALIVGIVQAFSIIPGISRSGSTIASGVLLGLNEKAAMKFAFLLSIPVILGANILVVGSNTLPSDLIWATLVSFIVGLISIHIVFTYLMADRKNYKWFGLYCVLLAISLVIYLVLI